MKKITQRIIRQLEAIGYDGDVTVDGVTRWLRDIKGYHVMTIPIKKGQWSVTVVCINHEHPDDGKLIATGDGKVYKTYDDAAISGIAYMVGILYQVKREMQRHYDDFQKNEEL